jgi:hypothetical protein
MGGLKGGSIGDLRSRHGGLIFTRTNLSNRQPRASATHASAAIAARSKARGLYQIDWAIGCSDRSAGDSADDVSDGVVLPSDEDHAGRRSIKCVPTRLRHQAKSRIDRHGDEKAPTVASACGAIACSCCWDPRLANKAVGVEIALPGGNGPSGQKVRTMVDARSLGRAPAFHFKHSEAESPLGQDQAIRPTNSSCRKRTLRTSE